MPIIIAAPLAASDEQVSELQRIARSTSAPHRQVIQAKGLLWAAEGLANEEIARRCEVDSDSVRKWRRRFEQEGVDGVGRIAKGRGRKSWLPEGTVSRVLHLTLAEDPDDTSTHWTTRTLGKQVGVSKDSIAKIWRDYKLQPWKQDRFKLSNDPHFEQKVVDVVGLYVDPPEAAVVFSFDEKTQCQALDRSQPSLPMRPGRAGTLTHDYKRNGTTDLFAALNVATGEVLTEYSRRHAAVDVLRFFKIIDKQVPRDLDIHVILDNLSAHKAPEVTGWLAKPAQQRWHLHFIPTSSSWLNLVERWFKELTDRRLRRGVFTSVPQFELPWV